APLTLALRNSVSVPTYSGTTWISPRSSAGTYSSRLPMVRTSTSYPAASSTIRYRCARVSISGELVAPTTSSPASPAVTVIVTALFSSTSFGVSSAPDTASSAATTSAVAASALTAGTMLSAVCRPWSSSSTTSWLPATGAQPWPAAPVAGASVPDWPGSPHP